MAIIPIAELPALVRVSVASGGRFRRRSRSPAWPCQPFHGRSLCERGCWSPTQADEFASRPERHTDGAARRLPLARTREAGGSTGPTARQEDLVLRAKPLKFGAPKGMKLGTGARSFRSSSGSGGLDCSRGGQCVLSEDLEYGCGGLQPDPETTH